MKIPYFFTFTSSLLLLSSFAEEVWTGDRIVGSPVEIHGQSLRIEPGARIVFKGEGRLLVEDGNLIASHAVFGARMALTNNFRIVVQNGKLELRDCRFQGLKTYQPEKKNAAFVEGFLRNQYGHNSRIEHCTFYDCSSVMMLNASKVEISRNLAVRCDNVFSLLNCIESRIEFNEFFNATSGFKVNGARLSECFRNRFTDCDVGIFVYGCRENRFFGNAFFGGKVGMKLWGLGPGNVFSGSRFEDVRYPYSKNGTQHESNVFRDDPAGTENLPYERIVAVVEGAKERNDAVQAKLSDACSLTDYAATATGAPAEPVYCTVFDDINGDGFSSGRGRILR